MHFKTGVFWSAGKGLSGNRDSVLLEHVSCYRGEVLLAGVFDGIGDLPMAGRAGAKAGKILSKWFYDEGKILLRSGAHGSSILLSLQKNIYEIQKSLKLLQEEAGITTGTTCSALLMAGNKYFLIHIGDSRIYRIFKSFNPIQLLKKDIYHEILLTTDDADKEGRLTGALGLACNDRAYYETGRIKKGSVYLLCTDGFYHGNAGMFKRVLGPLAAKKDDGINRRLTILAENAIRRGSRDNMSAVAVVV